MKQAHPGQKELHDTLEAQQGIQQWGKVGGWRSSSRTMVLEWTLEPMRTMPVRRAVGFGFGSLGSEDALTHIKQGRHVRIHIEMVV